MFVKPLAFLCLLTVGYSSMIIPQDLPSVLLLTYSKIPTIKKGTDSRVGFHFAFGNHADFQVMYELGPQTNTAPLTNQTSKINAKRQAPAPPKSTDHQNKLLQSEASSYLQTWASSIRWTSKPFFASTESPSVEVSVELENRKEGYKSHHPKIEHITHEVREKLKHLYEQKIEEAKKMIEKGKGKKRSEAELKKITEDLSNADLD